MLHPDSERRIEDIVKMSDLFAEKGFRKTAKEILNFIDVLRAKSVKRKNFLGKLDSLFNLFQDEFAASLSVGQQYRARCFADIKGIVFSAIGRTYPNFGQAIMVIYPFLQRLNHARRLTGAIADELENKTIRDQNVVFHLRCYAYLVLVEGIFDVMAKVLYFLAVLSKKNIPKFQELEKMSVWHVQGKLKTKPVFLEKWNEKKHLRNSIGHALVTVSQPRVIHFIDKSKKGKVTYNKYLTMDTFFQMALELEDSVMAFTYIFLLLRVHDLILSKNPYV